MRRLIVPLLLIAAPLAAEPVERADGTTTLPVPRFVSLKKGSAMMRAGPGERFPIKWEYKRAGLPMEILKEYEIWRLVRDPDGETGWMNKQLLTGVRTAYVRANPAILYVQPDMRSRIAWRAAAGVVFTITLCEDIWCRVSNGGRSGYVLRRDLWGTYPRETISG